MGAKIAIWADPRQIERLAKSGRLSQSTAERIWISAIREVVQEAGFDLAIEIGSGFDTYRYWDLTIGPHTIRSYGRKPEPLDYKELAATLLGNCQCRGGPCACSARGQEILIALLPVLVRNAQSAVEYALERAECAVDDASFRALREAEQAEQAIAQGKRSGLA
jgi:hypothetical protein